MQTQGFVSPQEGHQLAQAVNLNQRLRTGNDIQRADEPALTESMTNMHLHNQPGIFAASTSAGGAAPSETSLQDDFTLLDVIGGAGLSVLHPTKPIVAYTSGCIIIVFDLMSDTKVQLTSHEHEVHALAFTPAGAGGLPGQGGDFLISIDFNRNESTEDNGPLSRLFIWDWRQCQLIQQVRIPGSPSYGLSGGAQQMPTAVDLKANKQLRFFEIVFDKTGQTFMVLESSTSEVGGGYRVSVWNFNRTQSIGLVSHEDLELSQACLGLTLLSNQTKPTPLANPLYNTATGNVAIARGDSNSQLAQVYLTNTLSFLTVERNCIKMWQMSQGAFELKKRIHIKQEIKQCVVSELTEFMLILGRNGKVLILDKHGEFVSTVSKQGVFFTEIGTCDDRLLLGTERGTVHAYHIASLQFSSEIPYQIALLPTTCLNESTVQKQNLLSQGGSLSKVQEALTAVGPPVSGIQSTKDKRFIMVSYEDSSFAVIDRQVVSSLADAILGYHYGHFEAITGMQWMGAESAKLGSPVLQDQYSLIHQSSECFATCSSDLSVHIWRHFGDRWQTQYIDIAKCFDQSLSYKRKLCDKSTASLKLTAIQVMPRKQMLAVADNRGTIRLFEMTADSATLASTHQLQRSPELLGDRATSVQSIYFTADESVAVLTYDTGLVSAYDVRGGFTWLGDIEKDVPRAGQLSSNTLALVLERNEMRNDPHSGSHLINHFKNRGSHDTKFSLFSLRGPNCIRQQLVEVRDNRLGITPLTQFFIDEGKISGFDIHPSKDYILITSTRGKVYVFRIDTGELRGTIDVPLNAQGCLIDPSGLYVVVKVPPFSPRHTSNLTNQQEEFGNMGMNERDLSRTTILMYEVGTRKCAAEVHSIFDIAQMKFSADGRYLSLGSQRGSVSIWALADHFFQSVHEVIERMKSNEDFWCNYPLYLPDHHSQQMSNQMHTRSNQQYQMLAGDSKSTYGQTPGVQPPSDDMRQGRLQAPVQMQPFAPQLQTQAQPHQAMQQRFESALKEENYDQIPLRHHARTQQQPLQAQEVATDNTRQAAYGDREQAQPSRLSEVEQHSQDVLPSNYAANNEVSRAHSQLHQQANSQFISVNQLESMNQNETQTPVIAPQNVLLEEQQNAKRFMRDDEMNIMGTPQLEADQSSQPVDRRDQHSNRDPVVSEPLFDKHDPPAASQDGEDINQRVPFSARQPSARQVDNLIRAVDAPIDNASGTAISDNTQRVGGAAAPQSSALEFIGQDSQNLMRRQTPSQRFMQQLANNKVVDGASDNTNSEAQRRLKELYRKQSPHSRPLRSDEDYSKYVNDQKVYRDAYIQQSAQLHATQVGLQPPPYYAGTMPRVHHQVSPQGYTGQAQHSNFMSSAPMPNPHGQDFYHSRQAMAQGLQHQPLTPSFDAGSNAFIYQGQEPKDIDYRMTPERSPHHQPVSSQQTPLPQPQMLYTDNGAFVPGPLPHQQQQLPHAHAMHSSFGRDQSPLRERSPAGAQRYPQAYHVMPQHQQQPSFGNSFQPVQHQLQMPQPIAPSPQLHQQHAQAYLAPQISSALPNQDRFLRPVDAEVDPTFNPAFNAAATVQQPGQQSFTDDFEARMQAAQRRQVPVMAESSGSAAMFARTLGGEGASVPPSSYARDLIGTQRKV